MFNLSFFNLRALTSLKCCGGPENCRSGISRPQSSQLLLLAITTQPSFFPNIFFFFLIDVMKQFSIETESSFCGLQQRSRFDHRLQPSSLLQQVHDILKTSCWFISLEAIHTLSCLFLMTAEVTVRLWVKRYGQGIFQWLSQWVLLFNQYQIWLWIPHLVA